MKKFLPVIFTSIFLIPLGSLRSRSDELGSYWFGFGLGSTATLCGLQQQGLISNEMVGQFMMGMRQGFAQAQDKSVLNIARFNDAVEMTRKKNPYCNL